MENDRGLHEGSCSLRLILLGILDPDSASIIEANLMQKVKIRKEKSRLGKDFSEYSQLADRL